MAAESDICLLLEGTYPFVRGGVSSWVHQLLQNLPEFSFSLVFVGGRRADYGEAHYELPKNVKHLENHYLEDALSERAPRKMRLGDEHVRCIRGFHHAFAEWTGASLDAAIEKALDGLLLTVERRRAVTFDHFMFSSEAWEIIRNAYLSRDPQASFLDYFWTLRLMHGPMFQLARIAERAPRARAYHTISTGFAGLLGAFLERRTKRPLILSEHGIYTKERKIDLSSATWLDSLRPVTEIGQRDTARELRAQWIRYFEILGKLTYRSANPIISLHSGNQKRQLEDGAPAERTRVIVNGVDVRRFESALEARPERPPLSVGFVGRLVPIKDVKTFIRAMSFVLGVLPDAFGLVIGGADEDSHYAEECYALVRALGLDERIKFLGHQNVSEIFPRLGLLMLSSISEAQPLAVLEAFASGVPCVTTDVGACREQIEGGSQSDQALGRAGRVVPFAEPEALGRAAVELLSDHEAYRSCQRTALARVRNYYTEQVMIDAYRSVYREAVGG